MIDENRIDLMSKIRIAANHVIIVCEDGEIPLNPLIIQCSLQRRNIARYIMNNKFKSEPTYELDLFVKYSEDLKKLIGL